ncbi:MAG: MBL fold metallo-hydrolase [Bacillota bacterium]|nr:MBL fold metallo-hydrolase [Bacillota bacterium]
MNVDSLTVSMFATNCYIVSCPDTKEAAVIDPGAEGKRIIEEIKKSNLKVQYIINTHGHIDHIAANGRLKEEFNAPVLLSKKDLEIYKNPGYGLGLVLRKQPEPDWFIGEGDIVRIGTANLSVIETPGHTPGGVSLYGGNTLFSGDTLFSGSVGRTDLSGGSYSELMNSIREKILVLPPDTVIYPGHGPATTIQDELVLNPFFNCDFI